MSEHLFRCSTRACHVNVTFRSAEKREAFVRRHLATDCPTKNNPIKHGKGGIAVILAKLWPQVDSALDTFLNPGVFQNSDFYKGMLTGMCNMIYEVSIPYFATPDDVKREAMARRDARLNGESRVTPGLANITLHPEEQGITYPAWDGGMTRNPAFAADPPPGYPEDRVAATRAAYAPPAGYASNPDTPAGQALRARGGTRTPAPAAARPAHPFDADKVEKLKVASERGFDNKMLAQANNCTEAEIAAALAS